MDKKPNNKKQLLELLVTIVIPVVLLNKVSNHFGDQGPFIALVVALSFPIVYFLWDFISTKHFSIMSVLGFVNILLTGGFALFQLNSHWFAIKEMAIPLLIGIGVGYSAFTHKPLVKVFLSNKALINVDLIEEKLNELNTRNEYYQGLKNLTLLFAGTFLVSSFLNYILAINIVTEIPADIIGDSARMKIRNEQIADLTWKSYLIILVPSFAMLSVILWRANIIIKKYTHLNLEKVLKG